MPEKVGEEGEARVTRAAQHARTDRLHAVGDLEDGGHRQKRRGGGQHVGAVGQETRDLARHQPEGDGGESHDRGAGRERHQPRTPRRPGVARSDRPADPHGAGVAHAQRGAEGEARQRDGDLVRGDAHLAEATGQDAHQREHADLGTHLESDRKTYAHRRAQIAQVRAPAWSRRLAQGPGRRDQHQRLQHAAQAGRGARSGRSQRRDQAQRPGLRGDRLDPFLLQEVEHRDVVGSVVGDPPRAAARVASQPPRILKVGIKEDFGLVRVVRLGNVGDQILLPVMLRGRYSGEQ